MKKRIVCLLLLVMVLLNTGVLYNPNTAYAEDLPQVFQNFISDYRWSAGTTWSGVQTPKLSGFQGYGCCAYCADFTQYCFGIYNPRGGEAFYDTSEIRAGDVLTVGNQSDGTGHWFVCLKRNGNSLYVAEGNYSGRVRIGWNYSIRAARYFNEDSRYFTAGYHFMEPISNGILDVNGLLDGSNSGYISDYGTFDIYINGELVGNDVNDYYNASVSAGSSYVVTDIKATTGHLYTGGQTRISGTVSAGQTVDVRLRFDTCTDHSYGAGVVTKAATCTAEGVRTYTCSKCKATKTEAIPKLAHTPVIDPAVPATVAKTGLTEGSHCSKCGTILKAQQVIPKLPRVPYDFDMDGVAEPVMALPGALNTIEASAFEGGTAKVVIIPEGTTTIGSRAFADMPSLIAVFIPESVTTISFDVFKGSPNVKLYVAKGSRWGAILDLPAVEIENGWVLADKVPQGAVITDQKWTYTTREYKESSSASYPGWTKYNTQKTWSAWSGWQNSEISASSDREVRTQTIVSGYNMISYCVSGPQGRSYQPSPTYTVRLQHGPYWWSKAEFDSARVFPAGSYFDYAPNVAGYVLDGTAYCKWDESDTGGYIPMFIQETFYATQWSCRDASYTYYYYRDVNRESAADPSGQANVSNVQEWVKYRY